MILLIGGEKGGTGKTTLATNLAAMRAEVYGDLLIVDTDKQASASHWVSVREENNADTRIGCVQVFGRAVTSQVQDLADRYEDIIIDAGGRDSAELRAAMVVADTLVIPIQASQFDVWTLERMDDLIDQAVSINTNLKTKVVINRASPHPKVHEADEASAILADFEHLEPSGVVIRDRIAFRRAASNGEGIFEMAELDEKAYAETQSLYEVAYGSTFEEKEIVKSNPHRNLTQSEELQEASVQKDGV